MAYVDLFLLSGDATFKQRLQVAIVAAANAIAAEAATTHNITDEKRHALATAVLVDGGSAKLTAFALAVVSVSLTWTTVLPPTDAQLDAAISSVWNNVAGLSAANKAV